MKDSVKNKIYQRFLISKNNIILEVNREFLDLVGYTESELVGKTLVEASKILRIDSQVNLQDIEGDTTIFIFTKELVAVEGTISCKIIDNEAQKNFSFKMDPFQCANQSFNLASQLGTSQGDAVVIFNFDNLVVINNNDNHLNFHAPPYNKKMNTIGKSIMEILSKDLYDLFDRMKNHVINTGNPFYGEDILLNLSFLGETYWNTTLVPILENEKIKYLILYASNETEKVLNREAIKQRNEELETIIENISDEIIIFDKDFNIDISNKKIEGSITIDNIPLKDYNDIDDITKLALMLDEDNLIFDEDNQLISYGNFPFQRVARGEFFSNFFMKTINSSGVQCIEVYGYPRYDKCGNFSHGIMIFRDISYRIEKEESRLIKTQNELLTKVVETLDLGLIRCTYPSLEIISTNDNCLKKIKKINNKIKSMVYPIGESYFSIYPGDEETKRKELEFHLIEKGERSYINYTNNIVDGEKRFFKTINQPIFGLNNKIAEIIFITIDITDEVRAKNKMEETLEMQNQMFTTISHELKTPLTVIFSATQLMEIDLKGETSNINKEDISKSISIIKQNCYRFTKLINNIIDLSSMESGFYKLHYSNRNIVEIVEDMVDSVRSYVENSGLRIIFDTDIEEKIMTVDVEKIERIILNLISNAVKFSHKGGKIYIDIKSKEDFVEILVRDCGVGISKSYINTIFDKYQKVDNSLSRSAEGSGVGLYLVQTMVKLIGGKISVESELGKGSVFTVKLPVKILDESEITNTMETPHNRIEQINIEFSDVYTK